MNDKTSKNEAFTFEKEEGKTKTKGSKGFKPSKGYKGKKFNPKKRNSLNYNSGSKFNDVSWYKKNEGITGAFVKLPFNYIIGNSMYNANSGGVKVPVLLSYGVDWCANNTITIDDNDYTNKTILDQVATIIYTTMRRNNSGSTNGIEYVDPVVSNLLASIDILANAVSMRRVFKVANSFSWKNRLLPKIIFEHLGINYNDFIANQAAYRGRYNTLVAKARTIKTLANFDFINAICAQFENIFKDEDSDTGREQLYLPMKPFHHIYDPIGTSNLPGGMVRLMVGKDIGYIGTSTKDNTLITANIICDTTGSEPPVDSLPIKHNFSFELDILDKQIDALINDGDFNLIQADIEKAFGEQSGYMVIDSIPEQIEPITPIYSGENALMLKHGVFIDISSVNTNMASVPLHNGTARFAIKNQIVNTVYQRHSDPQSENGDIALGYWFHYAGNETDLGSIPAVDYNSSGQQVEPNVRPYLNLEEDDPGQDSIILGTRYQNTFRRFVGDNFNVIPADFRPSDSDLEIFGGLSMSNFILFGGIITIADNLPNGGVSVQHFNWSNRLIHIDSGSEMNVIIAALALTNFHYHPAVYTGYGIIPGEFNNIRMLTIDELDNIHKSCFLSLWDLPSKTNI